MIISCNENHNVYLDSFNMSVQGRGLRESKFFIPKMIGLAYENLEPGPYMHEYVDKTYKVPSPSEGIDSLIERFQWLGNHIPEIKLKCKIDLATTRAESTICPLNSRLPSSTSSLDSINVMEPWPSNNSATESRPEPSLSEMRPLVIYVSPFTWCGKCPTRSAVPLRLWQKTLLSYNTISILMRQFPTSIISFDLNDCDKAHQIETRNGSFYEEIIKQIFKQKNHRLETLPF